MIGSHRRLTARVKASARESLPPEIARSTLSPSSIILKRFIPLPVSLTMRMSQLGIFSMIFRSI